MSSADLGDNNDEFDDLQDLERELATSGVHVDSSSNDDSPTNDRIHTNASDDDDDEHNEDAWIDELECALLAGLDLLEIDGIIKGRRCPDNLRPQYWTTLLALNDAGKVHLNHEFNLPNQLELRADCEQLVADICREQLSLTTSTNEKSSLEVRKLRLRNDFESILTTYLKARPELTYLPGNGWVDILKLLSRLELNESQLYQIFFRIVDRYIPKNLFLEPRHEIKKTIHQNKHQTATQAPPSTTPSKHDKETDSNCDTSANKDNEHLQPTTARVSAQPSAGSTMKLISAISNPAAQTFHLLRLLIQYHDPEICSLLDSKKVTPHLYSSDWFCSLFSRSCSPNVSTFVWDALFRATDPFLVFFAATVMVVNARDELKKNVSDQSKMLEVLAGMPRQLEEEDVDDLFFLVANHYTNSTPRSVRAYSHLFFMDTFAKVYAGGSPTYNLQDDQQSGGEQVGTLRKSFSVDLSTTKLTQSLDLSRYLCLPIVPAELLVSDGSQRLGYFLVDCRPADQYNAGHLARAFHLDCSLMLRKPSAFSAAVRALLNVQRQVIAAKSTTGGQHLCFIGSGSDEEDRYVNMVVAQFLQRGHKYVSIVVGGFDAVHAHISAKTELSSLFSTFIVDHNPKLCSSCRSNPSIESALVGLSQSAVVAQASPKSKDQKAFNQRPCASPTAAASISNPKLTTTSITPTTATTTNKLGGTFFSAALLRLAPASSSQPAAAASSMLDKFASVFVAKSNEFKEKLVETINNAAPAAGAASASAPLARHVSQNDRLGPRYAGAAPSTAVNNAQVNLFQDATTNGAKATIAAPTDVSADDEDEATEVQLEQWRRDECIKAVFKCEQIPSNLLASRLPSLVAVSSNYLFILREIAHNKGFAKIVAKRRLDSIVTIARKKQLTDGIVFKYGEPRINQPHLVMAIDTLVVPGGQSASLIQLVKQRIVEIVDTKAAAAKARATALAASKAAPGDSEPSRRASDEHTKQLEAGDVAGSNEPEVLTAGHKASSSSELNRAKSCELECGACAQDDADHNSETTEISGCNNNKQSEEEELDSANVVWGGERGGACGEQQQEQSEQKCCETSAAQIE